MITFFDYINCSKDEELICRSSQYGLNIYDTNNFELLIKLDPYRFGLSGDITKSKLFYNSQIIAFSLIETLSAHSKDEEILYNDSKIKKHSLVLYDLKNFEIIGKIAMKNFVEINDFLITKYFIIIMIENKNKSLLFKTANLEYFKTLTNVESGKIAYSDDYYISKYNSKKKKINNPQKVKTEIDINKCVLAYQDMNNKRIIHLIDCLMNEDGTKVLGIKERNLEIVFNSNEVKYFEFVSSYLIVSSTYGNKVHLYDVATGGLKYCLFLGNFPYDISGLHLDNKEKIISIITNNKYIKLYKLNKLNTKCKCASHNDDKISMKEVRGMLDKFKHKLGVGRNDFLCRYKINAKEFDIKDNKTLVFFDKNVFDVLFIIQENKVVKKIKFDRKKTKDMLILYEAVLPNYSLNKNDLKTLSSIKEDDKNDKEKEEKNEIKGEEEGEEHHNKNLDDDDIEEEKIDKENNDKHEEKGGLDMNNIIMDYVDNKEKEVKEEEKKIEKKEEMKEEIKEEK